MPVKSLSVPSGMLSLCCTHSYAETFQSATMISPPPTCYALWQTKGCLILLSLSIVFLSVLLSLLLFSITPSSQIAKKKKKREKPSLFVNWPGSGERIVAKCTASRLSLTFRLFCSAFYQQTKKKKNNPAKADKAEPLPVCLSVTQMFYLSLASVQTEEKNLRGCLCAWL